MIEFSTTSPRMAVNMKGRLEITFETEKGVAGLFEALDGELEVRVSRKTKKRTLTQNAYLWVLIGELAAKLGIGKSETYRSYVKDYGPYEVLPVKEEAADRFVRNWEGRGLGWVCERIGSKLDGYVNVIAYYGSSSYDSKEMARMIDAVVNDCQEQGIQTMSMRDIMLLANENDG